MPGGCLAPARSLRTSRASAVLWSGGFSCPRAPAEPAAGRERPPLRRRDGASKAYVKGPPTADNPVSEQYAPFISALEPNTQYMALWSEGVLPTPGIGVLPLSQNVPSSRQDFV